MLKAVMKSSRRKLSVEEGSFENAAVTHLDRLFMVEMQSARVEAAPVAQSGPLQGAHSEILKRRSDQARRVEMARAEEALSLSKAHSGMMARRSDHAARIAATGNIEDPVEKAGRTALAESETLYGIADRMMELARDGSAKTTNDPRGMSAMVAARTANNAGMAKEIQGIVGIGGLEALIERTGLDREKAEGLVEKAGAKETLSAYCASHDRTDPEKSWEARAADLSDEDFEAEVRQARSERVEAMIPRDSEDRDTRVRRAALDRFAEKAEAVDIYGKQARFFHQRLEKGFPKDSPERKDVAAMVAAIDVRAASRARQVEANRESIR